MALLRPAGRPGHVSPPAADAALRTRRGPRLAARLGGPAPVAMLGVALDAGAQLLWLRGLQAHPAYLTYLLPVQLIAGPGVGLTTPALLGLRTSALPQPDSGQAAASSAQPGKWE